MYHTPSLKLTKSYDNLCSQCNHKSCCTRMPGAFVTPLEQEKLRSVGRPLEEVIEEKKMSAKPFKALKKINGSCIFLDIETNRCTIYEKRPFDCFLFPFDIILENGKYKWILHACNDEKELGNIEPMLEIIESMPEFRDLCQNIHEYATYIDENVLQIYNPKPLREVRIPIDLKTA